MRPVRDDRERTKRLQAALAEAGLDAMVCVLPSHVLLLTGYWPVLGCSLAMLTANAELFVVAPEDERDLVEAGRAAEIVLYAPKSLHGASSTAETFDHELREALDRYRLSSSRIGYERGPFFQPASYASMYRLGSGISDVLDKAAPHAQRIPADDLLLREAAVLTETELQRVRMACAIADDAFSRGANELRAGLSEAEVAAIFRQHLDSAAPPRPTSRLESFVWCMSAENSARAGAAYARTRDRVIRNGDLVMIHCNSNVDGFWTDITRTFSLGRPCGKAADAMQAVFEAREAALASLRPDVVAGEVDQSARRVLEHSGFGEAFTHGLGHGVGFSAISPFAMPRVQPGSQDVLAPGMVVNLEPAVYFPNEFGVRPVRDDPHHPHRA